MVELSPFFDPETLPQAEPLRRLRDAWADVFAEYRAIQPLAMPWVEASLHNGMWWTVPLLLERHETSLARLAPITMGLVRAVPGAFIAGFSVMRPGCEILPHAGYTASVWRTHLGLQSSPEAAITVGGAARSWVDGEMFAFDDTEIHSARNHGTRDRVVLILDLERHG